MNAYPCPDLSYCEAYPPTLEAGPYLRFGGGNFGVGSSAVFEPFTIRQWIYFDVNAAMQTAASSIASSTFNPLGGSRISLTNSINFGTGSPNARDFIFNFHFPATTNPNNILYGIISNNAAAGAGGPTTFEVTRVSSNPANAADRWYELEWSFSADGSGILQAAMTMRSRAGTVLGSSTLKDPSDSIVGRQVQGNRNTWIPYNSFAANSVALDTFSMDSEVPCGTE